jgi:hypothetical protein
MSDPFIQKMEFMYIETPPELDPDYSIIVETTRKEYTKEKQVFQAKKLREAFSQYGNTAVNWVLRQNPHVKTMILNDATFMNMYSKAVMAEEKQNLFNMFSPSLQTYGGFPDKIQHPSINMEDIKD